MISFRARHRQVVRQARADQIRREVREQIEFLARCEAGDPEALRQAEENGRMLAEACQPPQGRYFADAASWADDDDEDYPEPDEDPSWLQRPGESVRQYHRRTGRPDLAERRAAALLARGYWDANRPLPGAIRAALVALSLSPRELRRLLVSVWGRPDWRIRDLAPCWVPALAVLPTRLGKVERWLEVCLHTGPPAVMQRIDSRPEALLTCP